MHDDASFLSHAHWVNTVESNSPALDFSGSSSFWLHSTGIDLVTGRILQSLKHKAHVYLSNIPAIATENLLMLLFSLCSQHVSAPTGHLQVKYNYITYISWENHRYYNGSVVSEIVSYYPFYYTLAVPGHALLWPFPVTDWMILLRSSTSLSLPTRIARSPSQSWVFCWRHTIYRDSFPLEC
jgi:hypothetical protein